MKQHIKAVRSYRVDLPKSEALIEHLEKLPFRDLAPTDPYGVGFVPPTDSDSLVVLTTDPSIAVFAMRYDEKILPAAVIRAEAEKTAANIYETEGRRVGRKELRDIRENLVPTLLAKSHTKTTILRCYYNYEARLLIVPTASKKMADTFTGLLLRAVESIKATTIYVAGANASLTERLRNELFDVGDLGFDTFDLAGQCVLKNSENAGKGKITIDMASLSDAARAVNEAINDRGATVEEVGLEFATGVTFRLTHDFVLKGIKWSDESVSEVDEETDVAYRTRQEMAVEVHVVTRIIDDLCTMLGYKEQSDDADLLGE